MLRESTGEVNTLYLHGLDIIGQQQGGTWTGFGYDPLGSVRFLLDSSGTLTHALNYDPYGVPYQPNSATTLGFTGEQTDPNDLIYLRTRYYNPRLGTFTSVDPVLGVGGSTGWNGYLYANGNPANLTQNPAILTPRIRKTASPNLRNFTGFGVAFCYDDFIRSTRSHTRMDSPIRLPQKRQTRTVVFGIRLTHQEREQIRAFARHINFPASEMARHFVLQAIAFYSSHLAEKGSVDAAQS